jgi:hypothetical protein
MTSPRGFEQRIYDAFEPATPPAPGAAVVRQAQVVQTYTEATGGQHAAGGAGSWVEHADPALVRQAAAAVVLSRAVVVVVLCVGAAAITLAVLVRVLAWLS